MESRNNLICKLFGHKYEAIYNTEDLTPPLVGDSRGYLLREIVAVMEASKRKKKTYVKTQCMRCGESI